MKAAEDALKRVKEDEKRAGATVVCCAAGVHVSKPRLMSISCVCGVVLCYVCVCMCVCVCARVRVCNAQRRS